MSQASRSRTSIRLPGTESSERISEVAEVANLLGNQHRTRIVWRLLTVGPAISGKLAIEIGLDPAACSQHLKKLEDGGLVIVNRNGQQREYGIKTARLQSMVEVLNGALIEFLERRGLEKKGGK